MNTSLSLAGKLLLIALLVLVIFHFWPGVAGIAFVGIATVIAVGGALAAAAGGLLTGFVGLAVAVAVGLVVLGIALLPILLPILAIIGLVAVVRSLAARSA